MNRLRPASVVLAAIVGAIAFGCALGWTVADPTVLDWIFIAGVDPSTHFVGWHMFRYDAWTFPFGSIHSYGHPVGTSVALTDSIPLFALTFKLMRALLPQYFQYLGLWLVLCFVLQGVFGALLLRRLTENAWIQTAGATLFVLSPLLVHRAAQAALTAHWLILASLWLYFGRARASTGAGVFLRWLLVVSVASMTHPYLTVMVLALAAAALARDGSQEPARLVSRTLVPGAALVVAAMLVWWVTGYFIVGGRGDFEVLGFGSASMNLLSPVMPLTGSLFFGRGLFELADPAQNEGYAYLGAGTLFLLVVAAASIRPRWAELRAWLGTHAFLVLASALLIAFALGPRITVGTRTVVEYDANWWGPLTLFRSSGRMFWPVYYALTFATLAVVITRLRSGVACAVIAGAVVLQAADLSGVYRTSREGHAQRLPVMPFSDPFWAAAIPEYEHVVLHPTNMCTPRQDQAIEYRFLMLYVGPAHATINSGYAARHDVQKALEYCKAFAADIEAGRVSDDSLYVTLARMAPTLIAASHQSLVCTLADNHAACFTRASYAAWQDRFDVVRRAFVPDAQFQQFRQTLEAEYRDRMQRPALAAPGSIDDRLHPLVGYLAYRSRGCLHQEAVDIVLGELEGRRHLRLCSHHTLTSETLPPSNESMSFRAQLNASLHARAPAASAPTHVDEEGEVVWIQAYAQERLSGRSHADATERTLARIRAIAP
jgi:hypothetical protein